MTRLQEAKEDSRKLAFEVLRMRTELTAAKRRIHTRTQQRDKAKARLRELQAYVQKYQKELVELRRTIRKGPHE